MVVLFPATHAASDVVSSSSNVTHYAPSYVSCPDESLVRHAGTPQSKNQTLHPNEARYVSARKQLVQSSMRTWLGNNASSVYSGDLEDLSADDMPTLAISLSGGNFRAAIFGTASLEAFDARNATSVTKGLGGLLQSSTYMSALSGGAYISTSLMFNEFPHPSDMVFGNSAAGIPGWQLEQSLFEPGPSGEYATAFLGHLYEDLGAKRSAGDFPVTVCDFWGRALSYHFLPGTDSVSSFASNTTIGNHAANLTYSSATSLNVWQNHTMPFPVVVIDVNSPNAHGAPFGSTGSLPLSSVVYELTPFEFGSYDPQLAAFVSLPWLGSTFKSGKPTTCVNDFDNAGLMIGTSSCDFNQYNITNNAAWTDGFEPLIKNITKLYGSYQPHQEMDIMSVANPFYQMNVGLYQDADETALSLLDGSLDVESNPLLPLLVKKREVDVVILLDSSGETSYQKPDGLSLLATKEKAALLPAGTINFPTPFPNSTDEFMSLGLNARPVFFGCDGADNADDAFPLFVYIPNDDPNGVTNITTSTLQLPVTNQTRMFENGYLLASRGYAGINNTDLLQRDEEWGTCVACAVMERTRARKGESRTDACNNCFSRYCYTGQSMVQSVSGKGSSASSASGSSATGMSTHDTSALVDAAISSGATSSSSQGNSSELARNEYIIMGMLASVLVLLLAIVVALLRQRKAATKGYSAVGAFGEKEAESREFLSRTY